MPLYEFRCPTGHDFEKFYRSIGSAPIDERCPECGALAERLMSTAGLVFKGSGFYITDYGKDGKKAERDAAKSATAKAEKSEATATSSESIPGSKSSEPASSTAADSPPPSSSKTSTEPKPASTSPKPAAASASKKSE